MRSHPKKWHLLMPDAAPRGTSYIIYVWLNCRSSESNTIVTIVPWACPCPPCCRLGRGCGTAAAWWSPRWRGWSGGGTVIIGRNTFSRLQIEPSIFKFSFICGLGLGIFGISHHPHQYLSYFINTRPSPFIFISHTPTPCHHSASIGKH